MPIRWPENFLPTYSQLTVNTATGNYPPGYSQLSNNLINSPLELESWDINPWLILILIGFIIIIKIKKVDSFIHPLYILPSMIPFSVFEIDFRDSFNWKLNLKHEKPKIQYLKIQTLTEDIISLLISLKDNEDYSMSLSFIESYKEWEKDKEKIITPFFVDNAIIINRESDPFLITEFIMNKLDDEGLFLIKWLFDEYEINTKDSVILTVIVPIKVHI